MTIPGKCFDGWPIHPAYQSSTEPVPLVRSPKMNDISKLYEEKKPKQELKK
jgi:hypothetical protein